MRFLAALIALLFAMPLHAATPEHAIYLPIVASAGTAATPVPTDPCTATAPALDATPIQAWMTDTAPAVNSTVTLCVRISARSGDVQARAYYPSGYVDLGTKTTGLGIPAAFSVPTGSAPGPVVVTANWGSAHTTTTFTSH